MRYHLDFRPYKRQFREPTPLGQAEALEREGLIVRLADTASGSVGYGEIAPLESFGTESLEDAQNRLKGFCGILSDGDIQQLSMDGFACSGFALSEAARMAGSMSPTIGLRGSESNGEAVSCAALLMGITADPAAEIARLAGLGYGSCKIKLRARRPEQFPVSPETLLDQARAHGIRIRFDANESLSVPEAREWLDLFSEYTAAVEFFEQPLDRMLVDEMRELAEDYPIPIALDESLGALRPSIFKRESMELDRFLWVIKPALGDTFSADLASIPMQNWIVSSVFETAIGFEAVLRHAQRTTRPAGLGTLGSFPPDRWGLHVPGPWIHPIGWKQLPYDGLWASVIGD